MVAIFLGFYNVLTFIFNKHFFSITTRVMPNMYKQIIIRLSIWQLYLQIKGNSGISRIKSFIKDVSYQHHFRCTIYTKSTKCCIKNDSLSINVTFSLYDHFNIFKWIKKELAPRKNVYYLIILWTYCPLVECFHGSVIQINNLCDILKRMSSFYISFNISYEN